MHNVKILAIYLSPILSHSPYYVQSKTISKQFLNGMRKANISQQTTQTIYTIYQYHQIQKNQQ